MKYCPNPACRHRLRGYGPAEFTERATSCNDCGGPLVASDMLDAPDTRARVAAFLDQKRADAEAAATNDAGDAAAEVSAPGRVDLLTGATLLALSAFLFFGLPFFLDAEGNTRIGIAIGPTIYGFIRLVRGLDAREREKQKTPKSA